MFTLITHTKAFMQNEDGLTVVEYVIGAGLLIAVITGVFHVLTGGLNDKFSNIMDSTP